MLPVLVSLPFLGALVVAIAQPRLRAGPAVLCALATGASLLLLALAMPAVLDGNTLIYSRDWLPAAGLTFSFRLDGLSAMFALLILGIGLLITLYAHYYLGEKAPSAGGDYSPHFYAYMMLFMGSMLGLVLSENLLQLLVFWEMTSVSSFLLVGYRRHSEEARRGARLALFVTGAGGFVLLASVLMIGEVVGSYELSAVLERGDEIRAHALYLPILVTFVIGIATKSAQFPFHFWLPHAMAAPTPVSAYLHSATMVKAGLFLVARMFPALAGTQEWFFLVGGAGLVTLVVGATLALFQHDLKGLLAYSTISHLGLITLLFGMGTPLGEVSALFHVLNHAVFKASLFMAAGIIEHETGTRDIRRLGGLLRYMPQTAALAMVAAAAMAGVPLFNGFLSKEMFFAETLHVDWLGAAFWLLPTLATIAGALAVAYSLRFILDVFFGDLPTDIPKVPHEPPRWMKVPIEVLVVLCIAVGVLPSLVAEPLLRVAAEAVLREDMPEFTLKLWHGFNLPLAMSGAALLGGVCLYALRAPIYRSASTLRVTPSGRKMTERVVAVLVAAARSLAPRLEGVAIPRAVALLIVLAVALALTGLWQYPLAGARERTSLDFVGVVAVALLVIATAGATVTHRQRLLSVIWLGLAGLMVAVLFARFSAPDLALTQLLVEIVTVVLVLLAMHFLPHTSAARTSTVRRLSDGAIAALAGLGMASLSFAVMTQPENTIAGFFTEQAKPGGGGTNVVNVILVDFRAFDTLGEVTVLAIAAAGIATMLAGVHMRGNATGVDGRAFAHEPHPLISATVARPFLPLALLISAYLFLRGHNEPGGGFIAGLVTGTALIVEYVTHGARSAGAQLTDHKLGVAGIGVLIAALCGVASFAFHHPFLTSTFTYVTWPVVGKFEVASALVFDLGVYLGVVATVLVVLTALGRLGDPTPGPDDSRLEVSS